MTLAAAAPSVSALPQDADQPIHIRADAAEMDQVSGEIVYRGAVRVEQGSLQVDADQITVEYEDQKVIRIVAQGGPASYRQQLENPAGEVVAQATSIVYLTREERLELHGTASLAQQGNEISGEKILYDIVAGKVEAISGEGGSVRMVLQPASRPR